MAKAVKIINTFYDSGIPKYEAGKIYPMTDQMVSLVMCGHAEEVDVPDDEVQEESKPSDETSENNSDAAPGVVAKGKKSKAG